MWFLVSICLIFPVKTSNTSWHAAWRHSVFRLCDDYESIAEKALTTPANTEELMELKAYIEKVESDTIFVMEKRLAASKERLTFLSDHAQFSPAEIRLNAQVFMWHGRMPAVFEEHKLIVSEKRNQYEEALRVRLSSFSIWYWKIIKCYHLQQVIFTHVLLALAKEK